MGVANHLILQEIGIYYPPHESTSNIGQPYSRFFFENVSSKFESPKQNNITPLEDYRKSKGCTKRGEKSGGAVRPSLLFEVFLPSEKIQYNVWHKGDWAFFFGIVTKQQYSVPARTAQP